MEEIGRTGWVLLGLTAMAIAGVVHAVAGVAHIGRDMIRAPHSPVSSSAPASGNLAQPIESGPGGWILFSVLVMASGAAHHAIAGTREIIREVLHKSPAR